MVVPNSSPARSIREFIANAKANPGKVTFASPGHGTAPHLAAELFKRTAGIDLVHIPYRGAAPAIQDLIPGRVNSFFNNVAPVVPLMQQGQVRALALTSAKRAPAVPGLADSWGIGAARFRCVGVVRVLRARQDAAGDRQKRTSTPPPCWPKLRSSNGLRISPCSWSAPRPKSSENFIRRKWTNGDP